jgi:hypothetical protein
MEIYDGLNTGESFLDDGNSNCESRPTVVRRIICRYGRGCTHMSDSSHREKFWHPPVPTLTGNFAVRRDTKVHWSWLTVFTTACWISEEQLRTHYICNECAYATPSLFELQVSPLRFTHQRNINIMIAQIILLCSAFSWCFWQLHLQRKTAWSNQGLIGCRISCLVENKEWHEGYVTQYHKSGKHYVEFRQIGEKRWINMRKVAFYIVERPMYPPNTTGEYKEEELLECCSGLAPIEVRHA